MGRFTGIGVAACLTIGSGGLITREFLQDPTILIHPNTDLPPEIPINSSPATLVCASTIDLLSCNETTMLASISSGDRNVVPLSKISPYVIEAVIASEDRSFYDHPGINSKGIVRAAVNNGVVSLRERSLTMPEGGSSITQQDVRWRYGLDHADSVSDKMSEAKLALGLEIRLEEACAQILNIEASSTYASNDYDEIRACVKDQIIVDYLNRIYFGRQAYGIEEAAKQWFSKRAVDLSQAESIMLVATIKNPSISDLTSTIPKILSQEEDNLHKRYNVIVTDLLDSGSIDEQTHNNLLAEFDTVLNSVVPFASSGGINTLPAREMAAEHVAVRALDEAARILNISVEDLSSRGLRIITTIDPNAQQVASDVVKMIDANDEGYEAAMTALGADGAVLAMIGGLDRSESQVNLATGVAGGGSGRNMGSSNKVAVLADVLNRVQDINEQITVQQSVTFNGVDNGKDYIIEGGDGCYSVHSVKPPCNMSLYEITAVSSNTGFAGLLAQTGTPPLYGAPSMYEIMRGLGSDIQGEPVVSAIVGSGDGSTYGQATYVNGLLLNDGTYTEPYLVNTITDSIGRIVYQHELPTQSEQIISVDAARQTTQILRAPIEAPYGTAHGAINTPPNTVAGKTGTAPNKTDVWFSGVASSSGEFGGVALSFWIGNPNKPTRLPDSISSWTAAQLAGSFIIGVGLADPNSQLPA